jgi:hypothetical protein
LTGLEIFEPKWNLRLPSSNTQFLFIQEEKGHGQKDIGIRVAKLHKVITLISCRAGHSARKFGLNIKGQPISNIT